MEIEALATSDAPAADTWQCPKGKFTAEDFRNGSKYDTIKSAGVKKKTMLASEVSCVMSKTTAKAGKAFYCGQFLGDCSPQVAKINLSR